MTNDAPRHLAILGGGMAGLATAWQLTQPGNEHGYGRVTIYQRGHRLGGKGASSRGRNGRIEEHGLHVWLGYYDNAFRLIRQCYGELDRATRRPECPIATWTDAFEKASEVGVTDRLDDGWANWIATFAENDLVPGEPNVAALDPTTLMQRGLQLLSDFYTSAVPQPPQLYFSASPEPSPERRAAPVLHQMLQAAQLAMTAMASKGLAALSDRLPPTFASNLAHVRKMVELRTGDDLGARRSALLVDLVSTCLLGMYTDQIGNDVHRLCALDNEDFRDWLQRHGAAQATLDSSIVRGLYDLVFAFEDGDVERPAFPAGLGLFLAGKIFFDYRGAIFWKMTAGMGDIVFAPLYEALRDRGVEFAFFHDVTALRLDDDGERIARIEMLRQLDLDKPYEPLADYDGLPCFPDVPDTGQLGEHDHPELAHLESHFRDRETERPVELVAGVDFDDVVLATSIGAVPIIAADLVERLPAWADMVAGVPTVATQALQLWMNESEQDLGCANPGATVSGYVEPFDTWASMTHLLPFEDWDPTASGTGESVESVESIAYFCSPLATSIDASSNAAAVRQEHERIERHADEFVANDLVHLFPQADPDTVVDRYVRANVDPSDRYVRSQPGSTTARLRPDRSGIANLVLAGDWTDCGLNAGCIEAATMSGIQAANALLGRSRIHDVIGTWPGLVP